MCVILYNQRVLSWAGFRSTAPFSPPRKMSLGVCARSPIPLLKGAPWPLAQTTCCSNQAQATRYIVSSANGNLDDFMCFDSKRIRKFLARVRKELRRTEELLARERIRERAVSRSARQKFSARARNHKINLPPSKYLWTRSQKICKISS